MSIRKLLLLLTLVFSIGCLSTVTTITEAKTTATSTKKTKKKKKVKKTAHTKMVSAYRNFLKKHRNHSSSFAMAYLDNNNVPEMFFVETTKGKPHLYLYTYKNGKVKKLQYFSDDEAEEAASDVPGFKYFPKKSVYYIQNITGPAIGTFKTYLFGKHLWPNTNKKSANSSLLRITKNYRDRQYRRVTEYYTFKNPTMSVTKLKFLAITDKYMPKSKESKMTFYPNTNRNAKAYIK